MTERWRSALAELDRVDPSEDLWDRARLRAGEGPPAGDHRRRNHRAMAAAVAAAVSIAGLAIVVNTFGPPKAGPTNPTPAPSDQTVYREPHGRWELTYPAGFRQGELGSPILPRYTVEGIWVANFDPKVLEPGDVRPLNLPPNGVYVAMGQSFGGPSASPTQPDSSFPISIRDLQRRELGGAAGALYGTVVANGERYFTQVYLGATVSADDRAAAERIVSSLTFLPLEEGKAVGRGIAFYVLGTPDTYPIGSVRRFDLDDLPGSPYGGLPFFLVHVEEGFYALSNERNRAGGYKHCDVSYDAGTREFSCPNGARWALDGSVIARPPGDFVDDPFDVMIVRISLDGHVLVTPNAFGDVQLDLDLT